MKCKNCGKVFAGNFCPQCGQEASVGPLKVADIPKNIFGAFFNIDGGFGSTLWQLIIRPGYLIRDYLEGKRVRYFRPFQTLFVLAAIYILVAMIFNPKAIEESTFSLDSLAVENTATQTVDSLATSPVEVTPEVKDDTQAESATELLSNTMEMLKGLYNDSKVFKNVFSIVIMALANMIAFRKKVTGVRYNYVEHVFIMTYIQVQLLLIAILVLPFNPEATIHSSNELPIIVTLAIYAYDFKQLYGMTWKKTILRTLYLFFLKALYMLPIVILLALFFL